MSLLKNIAIKRFAKKRASVFLKGTVEILYKNKEMHFKEALSAYIKRLSDYESIVQVYPHQSNSLYEIFTDFLSNLEKDGEVSWDIVLSMWTALIVFNELSYDSSIGSENDITLVGTVVRNLIEKRFGEWGINMTKDGSPACFVCGSTDFEHDEYWNEYTCKNCGQLLHKGPIYKKPNLANNITVGQIKENKNRLVKNEESKSSHVSRADNETTDKNDIKSLAFILCGALFGYFFLHVLILALGKTGDDNFFPFLVASMVGGSLGWILYRLLNLVKSNNGNVDKTIENIEANSHDNDDGAEAEDKTI